MRTYLGGYLRGHVKAQVTLRDRRSPLTRHERPVLRTRIPSWRLYATRLASRGMLQWRHRSRPLDPHTTRPRPRQKGALSTPGGSVYLCRAVLADGPGLSLDENMVPAL